MFMNVKAIIQISLLWSFSFAHSMDLVKSDNNTVTDASLQKLIKNINNSSLQIVDLLKILTKLQNFSLTPQTMGLFFNLDQEKINEIFLANIEDDELRLLMRSMGAEINAVTKEGQNCLWRTRKAELLTELINERANVNLVDNDGNSRLKDLLYYLNYDHDEKIKAARILLEREANPNIALKFDGSLLYRVIDASKADISLAATKLLCEYKAYTNTKDSLGNTPLIKAIEKEATAVVGTLLKYDAQTNLANNCKEYPLHIAMEEEDEVYISRKRRPVPAIVILLLQHKADPNTPYPYSKNMLLHVAVQRRQPEIIKELIKHGAEKHHPDKNGRTALEIAQRSQYYKDSPDILALLSYEKTEEEKKNAIPTGSMADSKKPQTQKPVSTGTCSLQ